jgi:hypothetical protein
MLGQLFIKKHFINNNAINKTAKQRLLKILGLLVIVFAVFAVSSFLQINTWQQALSKKVLLNRVPVKEVNDVGQSLSKELPPTAVSTLSLVDIELPALPPSLRPDTSTKPSANDHFVVEKSTQKASLNKIESNAKHVVPTKKSISDMYQRLITDSSINIEIAWPNNSLKRKKIFSFLYQCIGMRFGVLTQQKNNKQKLTLANTSYTKNNINQTLKTSEWLRVAQGRLAKQERQWLQEYDLTGTPVRLFPKALDWQLAQLLTSQLKGLPLKSFRARYKYLDKHFMLTNISVNGSPLAHEWTLTTSECSI